MRRVAVLAVVGIFAVRVLAQEACVIAEQTAIAQTATVCAGIEEGQACYGSGTAQALFYEGLASTFESPADTVLARNVQAFSTQRTAENNSMVRLIVQGYALNDWAQLPVSWVLLHDATLMDKSPQGRTEPLTVAPAQGANLRAGAGENFRVLAPLAQGVAVRGTGRLATSEWVRVQMPYGTNGWIAGAALSGRTDSLPVVAAHETQTDRLFAPFTQVFLNTGGDSPCNGTSPSGALLQTPEGTTVDVMVNGVMLRLNGAVFLESLLTSVGVEQLRIYQLSGRASVFTPNATHVLASATYTSVVIDASQDDVRLPSNTAERPLPYNHQRLYMLPTQLLLDGFFVAVDLKQYVQPRPREDISPIASMLVSEPCRLTTGEGGSNLRAGAGREYPIMGVLGFRESARVTGRAIGTDGVNWWQIAPYLWVSSTTTVTGGDCVAVPIVPVPAPR